MTSFMTLITIMDICVFGSANSGNYDKYGGWTGIKLTPSGYFRTEKIGNTWWLVDPDGYVFISKGVNHIGYTADHSPSLGYAPYGQATKAKYGDIQKWAETSVKRLWNWNFNTIGAWSNHELFDKKMPYTVIMGFGSALASTWEKGLFPDIFSSDFRTASEKHAKDVCTQFKNDPFLVGYFTDNELRWGADWRSSKSLFDDFLALSADSDGKKALIQTFNDLYGDVKNMNSVWETNLNSFDDLLNITDLSQLGDIVKSAQNELSNKHEIKATLPKELIMLYLMQVYGDINKVNEALGTEAESFDELMTDEFRAKFTKEISKQELPKDVIITGIEMVYGSLEKANIAFGTNAKSYDELINSLSEAHNMSLIAIEISKLRSAFLNKVAKRYFSVCEESIRKYDKNHLILGCRFAGYAPVEVLEGMSDYIDVVSYNNYSPTTPKDNLEEIYRITQKPIMITEFSFKAMDSGLPNTKGAGVPVETQQDRADGFAGYIEVFMELPYAVGYHWFEYADEPAEGRFDGENSNYGLVNIKDDVWETLVNRMTEVNTKVEQIHHPSK